jgi:glycosyltransferase involved in cell wall biosynthesis
MKITYIVLKGMPLGGGIEKYTEEVGSRLVHRGHEVLVYTTRHYGAAYGVHKGMQVKTIPSLHSRSFEKLTAAAMATAYQLFEKDTDIVHFHAFGPALFSFLPRLFGETVVVQGHGLEWQRAKWGRMGRTFLKLTEIPSVRFPHALTVVSKVQQAYIQEKYKRESIYIPTGVSEPRPEKPDLIKQYGLKGNDYVFTAARLVREKGINYLIEAFKGLRNPDLKLVIAGDARHEDEYKNELKQLALGNENIIFTGFVVGKLLRELYSNCYLFVLPSEVEGLPTVLLEAMSYGNCCLVSDIPENLEALSSLGYSFQSRNADDLSNKLRMLINDRSAVGRVKGKARDHVLGNYSWDHIAAQFEDLYLNLLKQSGKVSRYK